MSWKPIIAGVDDSPEGVASASVASDLATRAGTSCHLIHITHDVSAVPPGFHTPTDIGTLQQRSADQARHEITTVLGETVSQEVLDQLEIWIGKPAPGLIEAARTRGAGLVVLGRKRHARAVQWLGGSTAHHLVRTVDIPLLLVHQPLEPGLRILAAVDLTYATGPTLEIARRFAELLKGQLMVLHVAESLPFVPDPRIQMDEYAHFPAVEAEFERQVRGVLNGDEGDAQIRRGRPDDVVSEMAREWDAHLVVVGSHGKNWSSRVIIGSTTEKLINRLETALAVVPVRAPKAVSTSMFEVVTTS